MHITEVVCLSYYLCLAWYAVLQALAKYQSVPNLHPLNVECLRYLVHICTDMGLKDEVQTYADRLRKAERQQTAQQQQQQQPPAVSYLTVST